MRYGRLRPKLHGTGAKFLTLLREALPRPARAGSGSRLAFARAGRGRWRRTLRTRAARRRPARRRSARSGLPVGLGQPRLANALLDPRPFPVARQRAGGGGTSPPPQADDMAGDPAGRRRPPRPVRTAKTAASVRRPTGCCARSALPCHRGRVQAVTAEAAGDPQTFAQLADLRHAVHGLADHAAPHLRYPDLAELREDGADPAGNGGAETLAAAPPRWFPGWPTSAGRPRRSGNGRCRRCRSPIPETSWPRPAARRAARSPRHSARPAAAFPTAAAAARRDGRCRRARYATRATAPTASRCACECPRDRC